MQQKNRVRAAHTGRPHGPPEAPRCIGGPSPPRKKSASKGGPTREMRAKKKRRDFELCYQPPVRNSLRSRRFSRHTRTRPRFRPRKTGNAAVYAPRVDNRGGALIVA